MKKITAFTLVLCIFTAAAFSAGLDYITNGEYAYYLDTRGGMNFLRGYLVFKSEGSFFVFSRNLDLDTKKEVNFYFTAVNSADGFAQITEIKGVEQNTPPQYLQAYIDFLNFTNLYINYEEEIHDQKTIADPWDTFTLLFEFNKALPLFRFNKISVDGDKKASYTLNRGGFLGIDDMQAFLNLNQLVIKEAKRKNVILEIPQKAKNEVSINGISVALDDNWKHVDSAGFTGYCLEFNSFRDSQISVEKADLKLLKEKNLTVPELVRLSVLENKLLDYNSVKLEIQSAFIRLSFFLYDENNVKNYQYFLCWIDGNDIYIVNFSSFADVYEANKAYYDKILTSIKGCPKSKFF